jgi:hypothetical protein
MSSRRKSFTALVRWRSRRSLAWEVDTRHPGFTSAEAAALSANGLGTDGFETLLLEKGQLFVLPVRGPRHPVLLGIEVWRLTPSAAQIPEDLRYERVDRSPASLSREGLDGPFEPRRFRVVEEGGEDLDVQLILGRSRLTIVVGRGLAKYGIDFETIRA